MLTTKMLTLTLCYVKFCLLKPNEKITNGGGHVFSLGYMGGIGFGLSMICKHIWGGCSNHD